MNFRFFILLSLCLVLSANSACTRRIIQPTEMDQRLARAPLYYSSPANQASSSPLARARLGKLPPDNLKPNQTRDSRELMGASVEEGSLILKSKERINNLITGKEQPPTPEEYKQEMSELAHGWFFGPGFGMALLNVGTAVAFPPYGLYLLGNAGLEISGFGAVYPTDLMPEQTRRVVSKGFSEVVSVPGRLNAAVFREPFNDKVRNN